MKINFLFQTFVTILIFSQAISQDVFVPRYLKYCSENMYPYFLNENTTKWICECESSFLYYPGDDSCYDAYRQGPCDSEHYLVILPGEIVAKCVKNPCLIDGLVPYQDKCHFLWKSGPPCESNSAYLGFDEINFELQCVQKMYGGNIRNLLTSKSCPDNTIFGPGDKNDSTWTCQCKPRFLYNPKTDSCYEAYKQGPCLPQHYFVLPLGEKEARCEKNPCLEDDLVPFKGGCHKLGAYGPPCDNLTPHLMVNVNTFQLECFPYVVYAFGGGIINAPSKACLRGSRRIATGLCKRVFE